MSFEQVPMISIIGMIVCAIVAIATPIILIIVGRKKFDAKISTFFIGTGIFVIFAMILETILHLIVQASTGDLLTESVMFLAIYGALAAAIFEETGRFIAFKFFLKKDQTIGSAFMYGVGHGGTEAILIVGMGMVSTLTNAIMINTGMMASLLDSQIQNVPAEVMDTMIAQCNAISTASPLTYWLGGVERISAISFHIAASIIMFTAIRYGKKYLILMAYLLHFLFDFVAVVCSKNINLIITELFLLIMAIGIVIFAKKCYETSYCS